MDWCPEKDCTSKCHSVVHAKLIQKCVCVASPSQLRAYAVWLCHNFATITDEFGRNLLHTASSCGKYHTVEWLLEQCKVDVDTKDHESGWTALHRSFYYGQLTSARALLMNGASLRSADHDGLSPLDVLLKDRLSYIEYLSSDPSEVYAWGSNFNYNLGFGNSSSRSVPEILEIFRKDFIHIKQVQICKFHSVFLSMNGKVYTCGYGHGGRLGQETEDISLVPSLVKGLGSQYCEQAMAGQDHLILLLRNGQVLTCGLNIYHQLGHVPFNEKVLVPKPISLKFLKGNKIVGVRAARFHSVIYTQNCIYTFGLNAGQLGHPKGERTQMTPRQVSGLYVENYKLTHVEVSDGATVCATSRGDIYVLHEYLVRKIASRQLEIQKLSVVGGHLDSQVDAAGIREGGGLELRVALLANSGKVYLWRQSDPYLRRCLFTSHKEILVSDLHINHHSIGLITTNNEGYLGFIVPFKGKRTAPPPSTTHAPSNFSSKSSLGLVSLLDTDDCHFIKVKRLPNIYRATSITSDSKGRNFAVLQSDPKMGLVEVPWLSNSKMVEDFEKLLSETQVHDDFHDIIIKVEKKEFAAHKYILASSCEYFKKQFDKEIFNNEYLTIENTKAEVFEQVLKFIYTNICDFLVEGFEIKIQVNAENEKKKKTKTPNQILILQELSKRLGIKFLSKRLECIKLVQNKIFYSDTNLPPNLKFNRNLFPLLNDVILVSSDGVIFKCHKCILIARLDYFHSMLSSCWAENTQLEQLKLPIPSNVLEALLDYLYTDDCSKVTNSNDVQFLSETLMYADQLMVLLLKEMCEISLLRLITLKNTGELLELSSVYNAQQLKKSCMQFICINLPAVIELKVLEVLSKDVMEDLSIYYRTMVPAMQNRTIVSRNAPSQKDLISLEEKFPVNNISSFEKSKSESHDNKIRNRIRCSSLNSDVKDCSFSEKEARFEKYEDVIFNVFNAKDDIEKLDELICSSPKEKEVEYLKSPFKSRYNKNGLWNMTCFLKCNEAVNLSEIMQEEEKLTDLSKKANASELKPIPHISQKQKKRSSQSKTVISPSNPPKQTSCPWAKLTEQSPPSPSFWDAFSKKEFTSSSLERACSTSQKTVESVRKLSQDYHPKNAQDIVISLQDIQTAEEEKLRKTNNLKIKSLHLINIEDQAIEELILLYKINDNHKEKITVARIELQNIANPIWKKKH